MRDTPGFLKERENSLALRSLILVGRSCMAKREKFMTVAGIWFIPSVLQDFFMRK
jgi:hypothetical protein